MTINPIILETSSDDAYNYNDRSIVDYAAQLEASLRRLYGPPVNQTCPFAICLTEHLLCNRLLQPRLVYPAQMLGQPIILDRCPKVIKTVFTQSLINYG